MQNATNVEQISTQSPLDAQNAINSTASSAPMLTAEFAIDVLKRELDDLQLKTNLIQSLDHKLIQMTESQIMDQIQNLTLESINRFLISERPGELQKKAKREKVQTGHGTISVVPPTV